MVLKVAVVGASGYTGVELLRLLYSHPLVEVTCVTSRQYVGTPIAEVFPSLGGCFSLVCKPIDPEMIAAVADVALVALPHKNAMQVVPELLDKGMKVIDLSADYRLHDQMVYEQWYQKHTSPGLLEEAVYGLPELYRKDISPARLVANPGCYPTGAALALAPLIANGLIDLNSIIIDSKSGASGAGRGAKTESLYCEVNEGFKAYGIAAHRHTPEIEQTLSGLAGQDVTISFTPHLLPLNRGILTTAYASLDRKLLTAELRDIFLHYYADEKFVRICAVDVTPNILQVRGSNFCDIGVVADQRTGRVIVVSVIDNLVKGAAGQAVQNLNLMAGFSESTGLDAVAIYP